MTAIRTIAALMVAGTCTASCLGQLGHSDASLVKRFGPVRHRSDETIVVRGKTTAVGKNHYFVEGEFTVIALVCPRYCSRITYRKSGDWTEADLQRWLRENLKPKGQWEEKKSGDPTKRRAWKQTLLFGNEYRGEWTPLGGLTLTSPSLDTLIENLKRRPTKMPGGKSKY